MQSEYFRSEFGYLKVLKAQLIEVLIYLLRYMNPQPQETTSFAIDKAINYIEKNFYKKITLEEISSLLHYTPQYFCSKFKQETGFGFKEYITSAKILFAKNLMHSTNYSITKIALLSGFDDSNYFSRAYKKMFSLPPSHSKKHRKPGQLSRNDR